MFVEALTHTVVGIEIITKLFKVSTNLYKEVKTYFSSDESKETTSSITEGTSNELIIENQAKISTSNTAIRTELPDTMNRNFDEMVITKTGDSYSIKFTHSSIGNFPNETHDFERQWSDIQSYCAFNNNNDEICNHLVGCNHDDLLQ